MALDANCPQSAVAGEMMAFSILLTVLERGLKRKPNTSTADVANTSTVDVANTSTADVANTSAADVALSRRDVRLLFQKYTCQSVICEEM